MEMISSCGNMSLYMLGGGVVIGAMLAILSMVLLDFMKARRTGSQKP